MFSVCLFSSYICNGLNGALEKQRPLIQGFVKKMICLKFEADDRT